GESPPNVLLGVRVVLHVDRERSDRVEVAVRGEAPADPPVAVPVVDDLLAARLRLRACGRRRREQRRGDEREKRGGKEEATEEDGGHGDGQGGGGEGCGRPGD